MGPQEGLKHPKYGSECIGVASATETSMGPDLAMDLFDVTIDATVGRFRILATNYS